ncbi:MAG: alpha/beta fold hydrolase [Pseudomonadota bacterium]
MLKTTLLLVSALGVTAFGLAAFERAMVYPLDRTAVAPESLGLDTVIAVPFDTGGATLTLWVAAPKDDKPVILYFHGNAGNLANRAERFDLITQQGYGLIAMAYRGSTGSTGKPSERTIAADAAALYDRMDEVLPGLTPRNTVLYGESLGTGVTSRLVADRADRQPRAVILEAPFTSIQDVSGHHMPWTRALAWQMRNRWNSRDQITKLTAPLLVIHGDRDGVIPFEQGKTIHARAGSETRVFLDVPGAGHDDLWRADTLTALWQFIDTHTGPE